MSAGCTHVSVLLHALVATFIEFTIRPTSLVSNLEEDLPVTSYLCQWKTPKRRKQITLRFADSVFEKLVWQGEEKAAGTLGRF